MIRNVQRQSTTNEKAPPLSATIGRGVTAMQGVWARLEAADPGLLRLRMGASTTATLVLALAILAGLATVTGQPLTATQLGVMIAMFSSMMLTEPDVRGRAVTAGLMVLASAGATSLGAVLATPPWLGQVVFLVVIVAAVFARAFGARGTAVGMIAFISYFFALFLHATPAQLPILVLAAAIGAAVSFGMRTILQERPERVVRRMLRALRGRISRLLGTVDELLAEPPGNHLDRRTRSRMTALQECAQMVQARLTGDDPVFPRIENRTVATRVYDAQLTAERLAVTTRRLAHSTASGPQRDELRAALRRTRALVADGSPGRRPAPRTHDDTTDACRVE